ncbi:MAG: imidazoleglycerol-phosphate dehydratase HisB [Lentisphaeria bacterium]|nr:imidazoleglycerol-phosphate dehydratase HisB [Lentisphaeria bacterium]
MDRKSKISRRTRETDIETVLNVDGAGTGRISTGIGFMDHMLELFARHGKFDLSVTAKGDLSVDAHHTMEDLGLVLGEAFSRALGDKKGIRRYGNFMLPMDETLVLIALDLSGRPLLVYDLTPPTEKVGTLDTALFHEFLQAFCVKAGLNLHIRLLAGGEVHHIFEAVFKGLARALEQAVSIDPRENGIPSTKGIL